MPRFLRIALVLILLLVCMMISLRLANSIHPSSLAFLFNTAGGSPCKLPCMFGVRPGETKIDDVIPLLDAHPLARQLGLWSQGHLIRPGKEGQASVIKFEPTSDGMVDMVELFSTDPDWFSASFPKNPDVLPESASIGDFIGLFGSPDTIITRFTWHGLVPYSWYSLGIGVACETPLTKRTLGEQLPIDCLAVDITAFRWTECPRAAIPNVSRPWRGFMTLSHYNQLPTIPEPDRVVGENTIPCR